MTRQNAHLPKMMNVTIHIWSEMITGIYLFCCLLCCRRSLVMCGDCLRTETHEPCPTFTYKITIVSPTGFRQQQELLVPIKYIHQENFKILKLCPIVSNVA